MTVSFTTLFDAFQPAREITDPKKFAGRLKQVEQACTLLLSGTPIFIHGHRGIGKTSLARQIELIANGNNTLLIEMKSQFADVKFDYVTCYIQRDDSIRNINSLVYRLMIDSTCFARWTPDLGMAAPFPYEDGGGLNPALISDFWNRAHKVAELGRTGLLIIIDEFERIPDHAGFASLLKTAPRNITFVITGIGSTERDLVRDHNSIERQLDEGRLLVEPMSEDELRTIVRRAEEQISNIIRFDERSTEQLIKLSQGQPYMLHLVGKHALLLAHELKATLIGTELIEKAKMEIVKAKNSFLEERYLKAIGNSPQRETVLRVFATFPTDSVNTSKAYPDAKAKGVGNPSYYTGDLQKRQYGGELERISDQYYGFRDPLFKAYVSATPQRLTSSEEDPEDAKRSSRRLIRILHLSDIHFGANHYFQNLPLASDKVPEPDRPSLLRYLSEAFGASSVAGSLGPLDLFVVSGDLTQIASKEEFLDAERFIRGMLPKLSITAGEQWRRLVIVPGNHDVNWALAKAEPSDKSLPFLYYTKFRSSLGGAHSLQGVEPERLYEVYDLREELGCILLGLNSAVLEGPEDHRGYIGEAQINNALRAVDELDPSNDVLRVAVFHHHIVPVGDLTEDHKAPDPVMRDAGFVKRRLHESHFSLILHGHRHHGNTEKVDDGTNAMLVVGCGSTGVVERERMGQPLQFNVLDIEQHVTYWKITVRPFVFNSTHRRWGPDGSREQSFTIERAPGQEELSLDES